ncbi:AbrB/MazE/SpoVT family DNA-binding domain-containing protein [Agarivorans sp. B2Z047]|nr:AbrB/MazE/SpoVT family DNA-binding domain-containing protein [Agarivorans sp. B2Z047]
MKGAIRKWGNSIAVRLPKVAIADAQLSIDDDVCFTVVGSGKILIEKDTPSLDTLLSGVTSENKHREERL